MVLTKQLLIDAALFIATVLNITFFWNHQTLVNTIAIGLTLTAFVFFHTKEDIVFYLCGAVLGTVGEWVCVHFGAWTYNFTSIGPVPLWVFTTWGFGFVFARRLKRAFTEKKSPRYDLLFPWTETYSMFLFIVLVALIASFWTQNLLLFSLFCLLLAANLYWFHGSDDTFFVTLTLILGFFVEIVATRTGAWHYDNPDIFNIPLWLIPAYGLFGLLIERIATDIGNKFPHHG